MDETKQRKAIAKHKLVYVTWVDSYGCGSQWGEIKDIDPEPHRCYSVGWVVSENDDCMVLVPHLSPENKAINAEEQGCGDMTIPQVAIQQIQPLKIGKWIEEDEG